MTHLDPLIYRLRTSLDYYGRRRPAARDAMGRVGSEAIFIFGISRSGSTWLQETIGAWPGTLSLFEPVHRKARGSEGALTLEDVGGEEMSPGEREAMGRVMRGEVLSPRILQGGVPAEAKRVCVKLINCNNGLPRFLRGVATRYMPLVILRHPCAHVASWKRLGWGEKFAGLAGSYPRLLAGRPEFGAVVNGLATPVERMAAGWCLGNYVPLMEEAGARWKVVRYENVQADPERELGEIFRLWGQTAVPAEVTAAVGKASRTTWREGGAAQAGAWRGELNSAECERVFEVCAKFGVTVDDEGYGI